MSCSTEEFNKLMSVYCSQQSFDSEPHSKTKGHSKSSDYYESNDSSESNQSCDSEDTPVEECDSDTSYTKNKIRKKESSKTKDFFKQRNEHELFESAYTRRSSSMFEYLNSMKNVSKKPEKILSYSEKILLKIDKFNNHFFIRIKSNFDEKMANLVEIYLDNKNHKNRQNILNHINELEQKLIIKVSEEDYL